MKQIIFLSLIFGFSFSVYSQNLIFKKGKFQLGSDLYQISEIKNLKPWTENDLNTINKIESWENSRKIWKRWTQKGCIITALGVGGMILFVSPIFSDTYPLFRVTGFIGSYTLTIVGSSTVLIGGTVWIITTKKRNKKIDSLIGSYNSNLSSDFDTFKLSFDINKTGIGFKIIF